MQKLCALRSLDQSTLASRLGLSKSSISRVLSGIQEPKLGLAHDLARELGVTLDYLVEDSPELGPDQHLVTVTEEELMILKIARRLGANVAIDRLLVSPAPHVAEPRGVGSAIGGRGRQESSRYDVGRDDPSDTGRGAGPAPRG